MSLNSVLADLGFKRRHQNDLERRLAELSRDISRTSRHLRGEASGLAHDWGESITDLGTQAAHHGGKLAEQALQQASRATGAVRRDPLPAIVVAGTALLVLSFLTRR